MSNPDDPITEVARLLSLADGARRVHDLSAAAGFCELARLAEPRNPAPLASMAFVVLGHDDLPGFQAWIAAALDLTPENGRASILVGAAGELAGQAMTSANAKEYFATAAEYLSTAIRSVPPIDAAALLVRLGNLQLNMRQPESATKSYASALEYPAAGVRVLSEVIKAARAGLIRCRMVDEDYAAAAGFARGLRDQFPDDPSTWRCLGNTLQACERYGEALMAYQEALSRGAAHPGCAG